MLNINGFVAKRVENLYFEVLDGDMYGEIILDIEKIKEIDGLEEMIK